VSLRSTTHKLDNLLNRVISTTRLQRRAARSVSRHIHSINKNRPPRLLLVILEFPRTKHRGLPGRIVDVVQAEALVSRSSSHPAAEVVFSAIIARSAAKNASGSFLEAPGRAPSIPGKRPGSSCNSGGDHLSKISRVLDKGCSVYSAEANDSPSMELMLNSW
jgi:hypothetical protein